MVIWENCDDLTPSDCILAKDNLLSSLLGANYATFATGISCQLAGKIFSPYAVGGLVRAKSSKLRKEGRI
jgi:hypothetical protein